MKLRAAVDCYDKAVALRPDDVDAHLNRGNALRGLDRLDAALEAYDRAIAADPNHVGAHANRATVLKDLGRLVESVAENEAALHLDPNYTLAHSNLLVTLPFMSQYNAADVARAHRRFGEQHDWRFQGSWHSHTNLPDPDRILRIGYLSPQFRANVLSPHILPLLAQHRRDNVFVHVFAHVPAPDANTERMRELADEWTYIHHLNDDQVAARVRTSGIDILIHTMGHWASNRLLVLARKPAPIQVSYLCQSPTTGLAAVDYSIIDHWLDHDGRLADLMTETPWHLLHGFQIQVYDFEPPIHPPPMKHTDRITFGSFNNPSKLSSATLDLWARVLLAVPDAYLLIKGRGLDRPSVFKPLVDRLVSAGIARTRIETRGRLPSFDRHMESYGDIDIALDTTPFTGGRTTLDALWMGVPVVTLVGDTIYGRLSHNHLMRGGMPELCAFTADDFVRIAVELAQDPDRLLLYRQTLRDRIKRSTIMDATSHVAELEDAYRAMWRLWCAKQLAKATDDLPSRA